MDTVFEDAELFSRVRYWKDFQLETENVFPTEHALRWFIRKHESVLVEIGVLLKLPRGTYIDPMPFSAAAINLMRYGRVDSARLPDGRSTHAAAEAP
jgi:hypothetical protein